MRVSYKDGRGEYVFGDIEEGGECLMCDGGGIEKNTFKKPDNKKPDYRCTNKDCTPKGGTGYWLVKAKQPAHQLKPTPSTATEQIILTKMADALERIAKAIEQNATI